MSYHTRDHHPNLKCNHWSFKLDHTLLFSVPPSKLELINTDSGIAVNAGTERQISCRARDARPQARIVWYQGDKKIVDQGQRFIRFWGVLFFGGKGE